MWPRLLHITVRLVAPKSCGKCADFASRRSHSECAASDLAKRV